MSRALDNNAHHPTPHLAGLLLELRLHLCVVGDEGLDDEPNEDWDEQHDADDMVHVEVPARASP